MNDLERYFYNNNGRLIHKWKHYFDIYDRYFHKYRNTDVTILEIGVSHGGSLQMWKDYFGPKARIYGIDIDQRCKNLEEEQIKIFIGSQTDKKFLREIKNQIPKLDILIDDGGHTMRQQIITFRELFDHVKDDGIYFVEDVHTSYWITHAGGVKRNGTFIEFSKNLIDQLNAFHSEQQRLKVNNFTLSANSIHFYDSIVVIEKSKKTKPYHERTGQSSFDSQKKSNLIEKIVDKLKYILFSSTNKVLRFFRIRGFSWF